MRLFLYGTLASPLALGRCAGRPLRLDPIPATLGGYRRVLLRHARYPTLRRAAGHQVSGIVVRVTADMLVRLQAYESFRYRQITLRLHTAGGPVRARCFLGDAGAVAHVKREDHDAALPRILTSPYQPPRPPHIRGSANNSGAITMVKAVWNNVTIADSDETVVVEGNHYFPRAAVRADVLRDSATTSRCPWKGTASYHSLEVGGETNKDAAWFYREPLPAAAEIKDRIAFWKGVKVA